MKMKLFYKVDPSEIEAMMDRVLEKFGMTKSVVEEKTILTLDDETKIEQVRASYDPVEDDDVQVRVVLIDKSLKEYFDSVFGTPFKVK